MIDILLRVNREGSHGTAPLRWEFQVCRLPSQHTVGIGEWPVCEQPPGSAKPPVLLSSVVFGLPVLFLPQGVRQTSTDSELLSLRMFALVLVV